MYDFQAKVDELTARRFSAQKDLDEKTTELEQAKAKKDAAEEAYVKADLELQNLLTAKAKDLQAQMWELPCVCITITTQDGKKYQAEHGWDVSACTAGWRIMDNWNLCGTYENAATVAFVIKLLTHAILRGDKDFTFPKFKLTVEEELNYWRELNGRDADD